jgi:hypothetical protein
MEADMESAVEAIVASEKSKKRSKFKMFINFLLYGGWLLVIAVGLATAIILDVYVF